MSNKFKLFAKSISFILTFFMLLNFVGVHKSYANNNSNDVMTIENLKELLKEPQNDNAPITLDGEFTFDNVPDSINPIKFSFNDKGLNEKVVDPNGNVTLYEYYDNGRVKKSTIKDSSGNTRLITTYSYTDLNRMKSLRAENANGNVIADYVYEYDEHGNCTLQKNNVSGNYVIYKYKKINKIKEDRYYKLDSEEYYDSDDKLTNKISYKYDNSGNRTEEDEEIITDKKNKEKIKYDYNSNNQLLAKNKGNIYNYDNNGNLIFDEINTNEFNESNQLTKSINDNNTVIFSYDENGLRTSKTSNSATYNYHYSGNKLIWITDGDNNLKYFFSRDGEENLLNIIDYTGDNPRTYWYVFDEHQNVVGMIDENGQKVVSYEYDAWGNIIKSEGDILTGEGKLLKAENPFRYSSYQYDAETGYYYLNARYYNPEIGRFISQDSYNDHKDDPVNQNLYLYCLNNPVNFHDESGYIYLTVGSTGEDVINLQCKLQILGYLVMPEGVEYGYYGSLTKDAVTLYQQSQSDLVDDGIVGDKTWSKLIAPGEFYLAYGSTGYKVELLQQRLEVLGYHDFSTFGYFGTATLDAVNRYKAGFNLGNSKPLYYGLVGDTTWNSLFWNETWNKKLADSKLNLEKLGYTGIRNSQGAIDKEWSTAYNQAIWDFRYRYNKNQEFIDNGSNVELLYSWIQDAADGNLSINQWANKVVNSKHYLEILGYDNLRNSVGLMDDTWSSEYDSSLWDFMSKIGKTQEYIANGSNTDLLFGWIKDYSSKDIVYKMTITDHHSGVTKEVYLQNIQFGDNSITSDMKATAANVGSNTGTEYTYDSLIGWEPVNYYASIPQDGIVVAGANTNFNSPYLPILPITTKVINADDIRNALDSLVFPLLGLDENEFTTEQILNIRMGFADAFDESFCWGLWERIFQNNREFWIGHDYFYNLGKVATHNAILNYNAAVLELTVQQGAGLSYLEDLNIVNEVKETLTIVGANPDGTAQAVVSSSVATTGELVAGAGIAALGHFYFAGKNSAKNLPGDNDRIQDQEVLNKKNTQASNLQNLSDSDIKQMIDKYPGHTKEKHIGKSQAYLMDRFQTNPNLPGSTTFTNEQTAIDGIKEVISIKRTAIENWLNTNPQHGKPFSATVSNVVGHGYYSNGVRQDSLKKVLIYITRDNSLPQGFRVHTAYPLIN